MPEAKGHLCEERMSDERWCHEDIVEHEEGEHNGLELEQGQTDSEYGQNGRCLDE
jgi:hypothetical protein